MTVDVDAMGVVAIDTVVAKRGPCSETLLDCDFELGMCGWQDDSGFPLEWVRIQAMDGAPLIAYDHTTNTESGNDVGASLLAGLFTFI